MPEFIMFVGHSRSCKEAIIKEIEGTNQPTIVNRHCVKYGNRTIDTPCIYAEYPVMHGALIMLSQQASKVVFVKHVDDTSIAYPPRFARAFQSDVYGIITYSDVNCSDAIIKTIHELESIGIECGNIHCILLDKSLSHNELIRQLTLYDRRKY